MSDSKILADMGIANIGPSFKGWTKPGPLPDLEAAKSIAIQKDESVDALCGHFRIVQLKKGHRFSTDDLLTAWYATLCAPSPTKVLDLGSGIGTVAMTMAWKLQNVNFVTVEAQEVSIELAKKSMAYNGISDRVDIRKGDFRSEALNDDEKFDLITGTPPYWPESDGVVSLHAQKQACRFEIRGDIKAYVQKAEKHLLPGGIFVFVFPINPDHQLERAMAAIAESNLRLFRWRKVSLQEGRDHDIALFACIAKTDLPEDYKTWKEDTLIIRSAEGEISVEYQAIKLSFGFPPTS